MRLASRIRQMYAACAKPGVFYYSLMWLMFLVVVGTISQKYIGLYQTQIKFFSSWYFWAGPIPLPGAMPAMAIVFFGLMAKLLSFSKWRRCNLGVNILHIGSAALLFGGFLTAIFSQESGMVVKEGEVSDYGSSYNTAEFVVVHRGLDGTDRVVTFPYENLKPNTNIPNNDLHFEISVSRLCDNCEVARRDTAIAGAVGFAANFDLLEAPKDPEHEKNQRGMLFTVPGKLAKEGVYAVYEFMPVVQTMPLNDGTIVSFHLRRTRQPLPFQIRLIDFRRTLHPGTEMAKSYESDVELIDGDYRKAVTIQMNEPLRYKGYTLFQSSFDLSGDKETSVFAVVKNVGWLFPYISSLIMALGLLIHLLLQVPALISDGGKQKELGGANA